MIFNVLNIKFLSINPNLFSQYLISSESCIRMLSYLEFISNVKGTLKFICIAAKLSFALAENGFYCWEKEVQEAIFISRQLPIQANSILATLG